MKVIFRADDVGYTPVSNRGAFRSVEEGVVSLVELMVDCPGSEEAMEFLKERPWISVNWHTHWWGDPGRGGGKCTVPCGCFRTLPQGSGKLPSLWNQRD